MSPNAPLAADAGGRPNVDANDVLVQPGAGAKAARGGAIRVAGLGLNVLLSLGSATMLVRHLGVAGFGRYVTAVALITIAVGLMEGGIMWMAIREFTLRTGRERSELMGDLAGLRLALTLAALLAVFGFVLVAGYDETLLAATAVASVGVTIQALQPLMSVPLQVSLRWLTLTLVDFTSQATRFVATVVLVLSGAGLIPLLAASIPAAVVSLGTTWWLARHHLSRPTFHLGRWLPLLREQLPFAAVLAVGAVYVRLTVVVLQLVTSAAQTGYFATAYRVIEVLATVPVLAVGAIFPILSRAARDDANRHRYVVQQALEVALVCGALLSLATALAAPLIIHLIGGTRARASVAVLEILAISLTGTFVAEAMGFALLSLRRYGTLLGSSLLALLVNVALTVTLGSGQGAKGAAISVMIIQLLLGVLLAAGARRTLGELRISLRLGLALPLAVGLGLASAALPIPAVLRAVLGIGIYFGVLLATRSVPPAAANLLQDTIRLRGAG